MRRRFALLIGAAAALLIAGVLVAPIVILTGSPKAKPCSQTFVFRGQRYESRAVPGSVADIAIGVGVASGCGTPAANVNVRSLTGVSWVDAVAAEGSAVYVRVGVCRGVPAARLLACLRTR